MNAYFLVIDERLVEIAAATALRLSRLSTADVHVFVETAPGVDVAWPLPADDRIIWHHNRLQSDLPSGLPSSKKWPSIVYLRVFAPAVLHSYNRLLYIDADIYPTRTPDLVFETPLPAGIGAVHDIGVARGAIPGLKVPLETWLTSLDLAGARYFNSGVLLIDPEMWRAHDFAALLKAYYRDFGAHAQMFDQDFLNHLFRDRWTELSPCWNFQAPLFGQGFDRLFDPVLMHFMETRRPWHIGYDNGVDQMSRLYSEMFEEAGLVLPQARRQAPGQKTTRRVRDTLRRGLARFGLLSGRDAKLRRQKAAFRQDLMPFIEDLVRAARTADPLPDLSTLDAPSFDFQGDRLVPRQDWVFSRAVRSPHSAPRT